MTISKDGVCLLGTSSLAFNFCKSSIHVAVQNKQLSWTTLDWHHQGSQILNMSLSSTQICSAS